MEPLQENLTVSLSTLPALVFGFIAFQWVRQRSWSKVVRLTLTTLVFSILLATWMLWMTRFFEESEQIRFVWKWMDLLQLFGYAVWIVGGLLLIWQVGRFIVVRCKSLLQSIKTT